jgi:hypothetical protein
MPPLLAVDITVAKTGLSAQKPWSNIPSIATSCRIAKTSPEDSANRNASRVEYGRGIAFRATEAFHRIAIEGRDMPFRRCLTFRITGGRGPAGTACDPLAVVRWMRWLGIVYLATLARAAHARAVKEIDPFAAIGRRSLMRSRKRTLAVSSSDIA